MTITDITQTTTADLNAKVSDIVVDAQSTDGVQDDKENFYDNPDFSKWYGYYKEMPLVNKTIGAFATWVLGKGFTADDSTTTILDNMIGRGDEDFLALMWNMKVISKVNGDSYAEIMRTDDGALFNIKPLNPENMRVIFDKKGKIIRYEDRRDNKKFAPNRILHFSNDRTADELGGSSVLPVIQWAVDARNEAMRDWRRISHFSSVRILYVDEDDKTRLNDLKRDYPEAIANGSLMIIPVKPGEAKFEDLTLPNAEAFLAWIRYLENFIFIAVGIPKVIMGSVDSIPESGGKISYVTYEQIYSRETRQMEADLWNQLSIKVKFTPPVSIAEGESDNADKNQAQTGFQPQDTNIGGVS